VRFLAEDYGPQKRVDIELGDLVTLFVGSNNTGKSFVSRAIYGILRSCRVGRCDSDSLAAFLMNSIMASEQDLWVVSRGFSGRFSLALEGEGFRVKVDYDRSRQEQLVIDVEGDSRYVLPLYAPSYRVIAATIPYMFEVYASEFRDILIKIALQAASLIAGARELQGFGALPTGPESDLLRVFIRSFLSSVKPLLEQRPETVRASIMAFSPTVLDVAVAIRTTEAASLEDGVAKFFRDLFPEFPYKILSFYGGRGADVQEVPLHLASSGVLQALPLLCLLNFALMQLKQGFKRVVIFIDEPELNLELIRQTRFVEMLLDFVYSVYHKNRGLSVVIATHSDFVAYGITRWLARRGLRDLARVYEFKPEGVERREIDEYGEVRLETFSEALRRVFFEEEFAEEE